MHENCVKLRTILTLTRFHPIMSKTLSLTPRADSSDKKNTSKRTPVRGHNRNNHATKVKAAASTAAKTEKTGRTFKSDKPAQTERSSKPASARGAPQSGMSKTAGNTSTKPADRAARAERALGKTSGKPLGKPTGKLAGRASSKPAQTVLRHGKMRDGVREFADGRVVQGKRRDSSGGSTAEKPKNPNLQLKSLRDERAAQENQQTQPAQPSAQTTASASKFNRAPAPERTASGIRISKYLADQGLCSRREADAYIEKGWVTVNGKRAELGQRVQPTDRVQLARQASMTQAARVTILINKPVGYVSGQAEDGYAPAVSLITAENQWTQAPFQQQFEFKHLKGLAPAGRLDIDSVGLLVLTQDGRVAKQLIGEDSEIDKEYLVRVEGELIENGLKLLNHGLELDGVALRPAKVSWQNEDQLRFILREGKKRQIRRMCELVGLKVVGLKRIRIGQVKLGNLPTGQWRYLSEDEIF